MGFGVALTVGAIGALAAAGAGTYAAIDSHKAAKASEKSAKNAALAQAELAGKAAAKEEATRKAAEAGTVAEAKNLELSEGLQKKKRGVKSSYTAVGSGAGNLEGTTLTPIGGGEEEV